MSFLLIVRCDLKGGKKEAVCKLGRETTRRLFAPLVTVSERAPIGINTDYCGREGPSEDTEISCS